MNESLCSSFNNKSSSCRKKKRSFVIHLTRYPEQTFVRSRTYVRLALLHACQVAWLRCLMRHRMILTLYAFRHKSLGNVPPNPCEHHGRSRAIDKQERLARFVASGDLQFCSDGKTFQEANKRDPTADLTGAIYCNATVVRFRGSPMPSRSVKIRSWSGGGGLASISYCRTPNPRQ